MTDQPHDARAAGAEPRAVRVRHRLRVRFRKQSDLRFIGHRDLLRTVERLFRRAGLKLGMSEGFHPKPRMNFPAPLAVGLTGLDEICEVELAEVISVEEFLSAAGAEAPPGLEFIAAEVVPPGTPKPRVARVRLSFPIPEERRAAVRERIAGLMAADCFSVTRSPGHAALELRPLVEDLRLDGGRLEMSLRVTPERGVRPREVLEALGAADLECQGSSLERTAVLLADTKEDA